MPAIGKLDRRVRIEQPVITRDPAYGSEQITWSLVATVWAQVRENTQAERTADNLRVATRATTVTVRYRPGVVPTMRLVQDTRVLQIVGVLERGRRQWLDIQCEDFDG
jgi:head-tail adaptor